MPSRRFVLLALLALFGAAGTVPAAAQSKAIHTATGVVIALDRDKRKVTVDAEPVEDLGLPALALAFIASRREGLDKVRVGQRVKVEFVEQGRNFAITRITPLPAPKPAQTHESLGY